MLILTLRVLTVVGYGALTVALLRLRAAIRPSSQPAARVWRWLALPYGLIALNAVLFEARLALRPYIADPALGEFLRVTVYQALYLTQTLIGAAIPIVLLALLPRHRSWRRIAWAALAVMVAVAMVGVARDALADWDVLLGSTRVIYFISIAAHLLFWALFALAAVEAVGTHLAVFMAIETVFVLLIPAQEAYFQVLGLSGADQIWHLNQFLQMATAFAQAGVVIWLLRVGARVRPTRVEAVTRGTGQPRLGL
ncbi:MAG: hypothetical protein ACOC8B_01085 [Gemmatimonadota bacterium]